LGRFGKAPDQLQPERRMTKAVLFRLSECGAGPAATRT
jgi:hypothetical protein